MEIGTMVKVVKIDELFKVFEGFLWQRIKMRLDWD